MAEIKTVKLKNFSMDYFSFGSGEKVMIMLPGMSVTSVMLSADAVESAYSIFKKDFTVYLFDCIKNMPKGYSVEDMARDTASAIKALGLKDIYIFGASQGGMIAQVIAARHPELVKKILVASSVSLQNDVSKNNFEKWKELASSGDCVALNTDVFYKIYSENFIKQNKAAIDNLLNCGTSEELDRFYKMADACENYEFLKMNCQIECPVLVIGALKDKVFTPDIVNKTARMLGAELYMYEDYGHAVYDEAPDYKTRIMNFFNSK